MICDVLTARCQHPRRDKQRGVLLVSALVMVIVFGALLTMWAQRESAATRVERARSIGDALAVLGNGLDDYIKNNHKAIVQNTEIRSGGNGKRGVTSPRQISARDLITYMDLRGVGDRPPHMPKGEYRIQIEVSKRAASDAPKSLHRVTALLYIDAPVQHRGRPDLVMAKIAAKQMGRHGGMTEASNPDVVTFNDGTNNVPVPVANPIAKDGTSGKFIAGVLVRRAGDVLSSSNEDYLPRNGSLAMTGTLDLGAQDIKKVGKFESDGLMWLKGGDNSKSSSKLGLWVGDWRGDEVSGTPRGIMASGSITSLDTLHGLKASIGKGETLTEVTGDGVETPYVWARNASRDQPDGMPLPDRRAGDVYASEAIRAGGNIYADGHIRVGKGLIVGYPAKAPFEANGDLWVAGDGHIARRLVAHEGLEANVKVFQQRRGYLYWRGKDDKPDYNENLYVDNETEPPSEDGGAKSIRVNMIAKMFRFDLRAVSNTKGPKNQAYTMNLGKWLTCGGDLYGRRTDVGSDYLGGTLKIDTSFNWKYMHFPFRFEDGKLAEVTFVCFGHIVQ